LYGGAAGGGKTEALLWWLGEGIHVPSYSGVFFRRTYAQLSKSNDSPITKAFELYGPLGGTYKSSEHRWKFPSGATIEFGHLQHEDSVHDYQGPAYHRVAFDELTQFSEQQYLYLFSRMRMRKDFPVRMGIRAASNPGGPGHAWVKERFVTREAQTAIQQLSPREPSPAGMMFWPTENRAFVPARVADNPSLDVDDYIERMLTHLPAVLRERLLNGDWSVVEDALIRAEWLRYFKMRGADMLIPLDVTGAPLGEIDCRQIQRIATIDTAGTSQQKADERKGKPPSWSVCQVWDFWPETRFLFLRHVWRARVNWNDLKAHVRGVLKEWKPNRVLIENAHHGPPLAAELGDEFRVDLVSTSAHHVRGEEGRPGKVERATPLLNKLEKGEVFLPRYNNQWLSDLEGEWLSWTGLADETADQIDAAAYAVNDLLQYDGRETGDGAGTVLARISPDAVAFELVAVAGLRALELGVAATFWPVLRWGRRLPPRSRRRACREHGATWAFVVS
jgi:phage terminase large subunit-like protein